MAKGKQATTRMSPTKAVMQFRLAEMERQLKLITEKHNLLAKRFTELVDRCSTTNDMLTMLSMAQGRLIKMALVTEQLVEAKLGITPEDMAVAEAQVESHVKENDQKLQEIRDRLNGHSELGQRGAAQDQVTGSAEQVQASDERPEPDKSATEGGERPALRAV